MICRDRRGREALALEIGRALDPRTVAHDQRLVGAGDGRYVEGFHVEAAARSRREGARADIADLHIARCDGRENVGTRVELAELDLAASHLGERAAREGDLDRVGPRLVGDHDPTGRSRECGSGHGKNSREGCEAGNKGCHDGDPEAKHGPHPAADIAGQPGGQGKKRWTLMFSRGLGRTWGSWPTAFGRVLATWRDGEVGASTRRNAPYRATDDHQRGTHNASGVGSAIIYQFCVLSSAFDADGRASYVNVFGSGTRSTVIASEAWRSRQRRACPRRCLDCRVASLLAMTVGGFLHGGGAAGDPNPSKAVLACSGLSLSITRVDNSEAVDAQSAYQHNISGNSRMARAAATSVTSALTNLAPGALCCFARSTG